MDTSIAYNSQKILTDSVYVNDVGNCALEAIDEKGFYYYFITITKEGFTQVCTFGPCLPEVHELPGNYIITYYRQTYNDSKLAKAIQTWATPKKGNYTTITQVDLSTALENCRNMALYLLED